MVYNNKGYRIMTNKERWLSAAALMISILPFILVASSLQLFPDRIIFNILGAEKPLTLGKYQYLYLGLMGFVPALLVIFARVFRARRLVDRNFKYMILSALVLGVVFLLAIAYGMIYNIYKYDIDLLMTFEFFGAAALLASLTVGMLANFLPVLRRNDAIGLKNKYTIADNRVWIKVHHVAADVYMATMFAFALFSSALSIWLDFRYGWVHIVLWVAVVSALIIWGRLYSKAVYNRLLRGRILVNK